jgi:hypothetical protein
MTRKPLELATHAAVKGNTAGLIDGTLGKSCDPRGAFIRRPELAEHDFSDFKLAYVRAYKATAR